MYYMWRRPCACVSMLQVCNITWSGLCCLSGSRHQADIQSDQRVHALGHVHRVLLQGQAHRGKVRFFQVRHIPADTLHTVQCKGRFACWRNHWGRRETMAQPRGEGRSTSQISVNPYPKWLKNVSLENRSFLPNNVAWNWRGGRAEF